MYPSFGVVIIIVVLLFHVGRGSVNADGTRYIGCYEDNDEDSSISEKRIGDYLQLTSAYCINRCEKLNYPYAAFKNGTWCYCTSLAPPLYRRVNETFGCMIKCSGNTTEICGGPWAYSVHHTNVKDRSLFQGFYSVGCFDSEKTIFDRYIIEMNEVTPFKCQEICYRMGFLYFGIEKGKQCTCKDQVTRKIKIDAKCNIRCAGYLNGNMMCGGNSESSIYSTSITDYPVEDLDIGCFAIDSKSQTVIPSNLSLELVLKNTPQRCMNICMQKGYSYSGVSFVTKCYCFNHDPSKNFNEIQLSFCYSECPGDSSELTCGQENSILIYRTQTIDTYTEYSSYRLICYKLPTFKTFADIGPYKITSMHVTTFEECKQSCASKEFKLAAMTKHTNSTLCTCLHELLPAELMVSNNECLDEVEISRLSRVAVYNTVKGYKSTKPRSYYDGCISNRYFAREYVKPVANLNINICHNICLYKGFLYFGLFNKRSECLCGNKLLKPYFESSSLYDENSCNAVCPGNPYESCGSSTHVSVYKTGIPDHTWYKFYQCYEVQNGNTNSLFDITKIIPETNSPSRCFNLCYAHGYTSSAVGNRIECHCTNKKLLENVSKTSQLACGLSCPGDKNYLCGNTSFINFYTDYYYTSDEILDLQAQHGVGNNEKPSLEIPKKKFYCNDSITTVKGVNICESEIVFYDTFEDLNLIRWKNVIKIAWDPDYEFVVYDNSRSNSYVESGSLIIKPTVRENYIRTGSLQLENCTGVSGSVECTRQAQGYLILPPIASARITTEESFTFKYGIVTVIAKLPRGDWILPEIWLQPVGDRNPEEAIKISFARGNEHYQCYRDDIGVNRLESGYCISGYNTEACPFIIKRGWNENYHNFTFVWKPDKMEMTVDGTRTMEIKSEKGVPDKEHYLVLGVSAGGIKEFPDSCTTSDWTIKPWGNTSPQAMLNFWEKSENWKKTWINDDVALKVAEIKITAI